MSVDFDPKKKLCEKDRYHSLYGWCYAVDSAGFNFQKQRQSDAS